MADLGPTTLNEISLQITKNGVASDVDYQDFIRWMHNMIIQEIHIIEPTWMEYIDAKRQAVRHAPWPPFDVLNRVPQYLKQNLLYAESANPGQEINPL